MSSSPFRASPRQRVIVAVLALLLLLALTTVVPWLTYVGGGKRAVEARMTELRNAGYTLTLEELNEEYHGHSFEPADNAAPVMRRRLQS